MNYNVFAGVDWAIVVAHVGVLAGFRTTIKGLDRVITEQLAHTQTA